MEKIREKCEMPLYQDTPNKSDCENLSSNTLPYDIEWGMPNRCPMVGVAGNVEYGDDVVNQHNSKILH